jgi:hypothetical protein
MRCLLGFVLCIQASNTMATPVNNCSTEDIEAMIFAAEIKHKIPEGLLAAIAKVESGNRAYAVNLGGRFVYSSSFAEALSTAKAQIKAVRRNIDFEVMQLNYPNVSAQCLQNWLKIKSNNESNRGKKYVK